MMLKEETMGKEEVRRTQRKILPFEHGSWRYQARRALLARVVPVYQTAHWPRSI
jgi:hypothetical protein